MKPKILESNDTFKNIKSYSVDEILAAGGPTAFAEKTGKTFENMLKVMENAPKPEPFTEEEWADLMEQLAKDK